MFRRAVSLSPSYRSGISDVSPQKELRKTVTVVFADIVDSTGLGERLDPELLRHVMSRYYDEMRTALEQHGGTVTKLMGDAVLAVFGIPTVHEDDALRALTAASHMQRTLEDLNVEMTRERGVTLETKIAINTGEAVVPEQPREEDFIVADVVNVAARLEERAKPGEILLGEGTYRIARDAIEVEQLAPLELKGKAQPVGAFRLVEVRPGVPPAARPFQSPLVGRLHELATLNHALDRAIDRGSCALMTVLGAAGVGKSRLVREFSAGLGDRAQVVEGRCLSYGEGITFWPVAEIVKDVAEIVDDDSRTQARKKIAALVPNGEGADFVADRLAATIGISDAVSPPEETFWAIRRLFEAIARDRPLVVVFEDIHWGEETFLDLVEYLAGFINEAPLLLVPVARPDLLELRPSWSRAVEKADILSLRPLGSEESNELVQGLLGESGLARAVADPINRSAQGNPLFVEEMLRLLVDEGVLARKNGSWVWVKEPAAVPTPPSIQALLASRIDRLAADERAVIERASIVGEEFWAGAVSALSANSSKPAVWGVLQALVRRQLIRPGGTPFGGEDAFTFSHILIRDTAYEGILKETRAELHEQFADWLERRAGERVGEYQEIVGYHLEQACRYREELGEWSPRRQRLAAQAARHLASAGSRASGRGDMPAAANLLERALALEGKETEQSLEMMLDLSHALSELELPRAYDLLVEVAATAAAQGNRRIELRALLERADLRIWTSPEGNLDELRRTAEEAIALCRELDDDVGLAKAFRNLATFHVFGARWGQAGDFLGRALSHARRAGDQQVAQEMLPGLAAALCLGPVPAEDAITRLDRILRELSTPSDAEAGAIVSRGIRAAVEVRGLAGLHAIRGRLEEARAICARARRDLEEIGQTRRLADTAEISATIEMLAGNPAAAERELRFSYETLSAVGDLAVLSTVAAELGGALCAQGRYEEAEQLTVESARLAAADDVESQVRWRITRARLLAHRGDFGEAASVADEAVSRATPTEFPDLLGDALLARAEVLKLAGRRGEAERAAIQAREVYEGKGDLVSAARARELIPSGG
jgi:class 3 adenylate cyclase/tetratricopeptide (TPR) repeat protein